MPPDEQVVDDGRVLEQFDVLKRARHAEARQPIRGETGNILARQCDASRRGRVEPADNVEDGRLAGAVWADDGEDLSGLDREGHAVHRHKPAEAD